MNLKKKSEYLDLNPEKMIRVFFCTVLLLSGLSIKAQTGFSLQDCRNLAIENNKRLKIADEEILAGLAQKEEAFTKYLPGVDATGVYMRNQKKIHLLEQDAYLPVGGYSGWNLEA